jgi:hypothetical protein
MDRAELERAVDHYLDALVAGDPSRLRASQNVVFVENYQRLPLGEGSWATITGRGSYSHYFADVQEGQAGFIGTVRENGLPALMDLRLRLDGGRIAEIESFIIRDALAGLRYEQTGVPEPVWLEPVPPEKRQPRSSMIAAVDKYFQSMQRNDGLGDYSFFHPDCNRIEHALQTTNVKTAQAYGHSHDTEFSSMSAEAQWKTGFLGFVTEIRDRRFVVIDEERQAVFAFATFDHNGTVRVLHQTTGKDFVVPPYFDVPRTLQVMEAFRLEGDRLYRIEMTLTELPYGIRPPWPAPAPAVSAPAGPADRAVLEHLLEQVLAAMQAHDASSLPLAPDVRYTENGQVLQLGDGLWATLGDYAAWNDVRRYRVILADPAKGEAAFVGAIREETTPGVLALRIRAPGGRIAEIEAVAVRHEEMGERGGTVSLFQPRLLTELRPQAFEEPASELLALGAPEPHEAIERAVQGWFRAIADNDSAAAPLAADCVRRENGVRATSNPDAEPLDPALPEYRPFALSCAQQIDSGYFARIAAVREARHLIDESRGLALSLAVLDNPGRLKSIEVPGVGEVALPGRKASGPGAEINSAPDESQLFGARMQPNVLVPTSELLVQLTQVQANKIERIEALTRGGPYGLSSGWSS